MTEKSISLSLTGGPPWGFRLRGGPGQGLRVSRVRRRSPASAGGLREGDLLLSVNSTAMAGRTYAHVMDFIDRHRALAVEVRRFVSQDCVTLQTMAADWGSDDEADEAPMEEPPLQELQVAELQLAPSQPQPQPLWDDDDGDDNDYVEGEDTVMPADPEIRPVPLSKLITEAQPEPTPPRSPVRKYADSAYFDASAASYPTVEEQKEMARRVAETLTDVRNRGSRGSSMFEKRRERAAKYTLEGPEPDGDEAAAAEAMIDTSVGGPLDEGGIARVPMPPPAPPPPPPPGQGFRFPVMAKAAPHGPPPAPPPPPPPKTVAEFVEREMRSAPKLTHRDYDPKKAFDIASALHASSGKAGQMFQKRRQRALKFTTESEGQSGSSPGHRGERRAEPAVAVAAAPGPSSGLLPQLKPGGNDASLAAKIQRLQENLDGGGAASGWAAGGGGLSDL